MIKMFTIDLASVALAALKEITMEAIRAFHVVGCRETRSENTGCVRYKIRT